MNVRSRFRTATTLTKLTAALVMMVVVTGLAWANVTKQVTALSGVPKRVAKHWRVDDMGREHSVSVQFTSRPANGTVRTQVSVGPMTLHNGTTKVVHRTEVIYQSKKGYVGQDTFTYRRVSSDPGDRDNEEVTVLVTVE